jgi:hypothetical protein
MADNVEIIKLLLEVIKCLSIFILCLKAKPLNHRLLQLVKLGLNKKCLSAVSGELDIGCCDAVLPVEEKEGFVTFDEICILLASSAGKNSFREERRFVHTVISSRLLFQYR